MKFAKSEYGLYDNINFDSAGNIITMNNKNDFTILSGSDLTSLNNTKYGETPDEEIKNTNWLQFDFFMEGIDEEFNKVVTYFGKEEGKNVIKAYQYK